MRIARAYQFGVSEFALKLLERVRHTVTRIEMGADGKAPRGRACPPFVLAAFVMSVVMGCFTLFSSSASLLSGAPPAGAGGEGLPDAAAHAAALESKVSLLTSQAQTAQAQHAREVAALQAEVHKLSERLSGLSAAAPPPPAAAAPPGIVAPAAPAAPPRLVSPAAPLAAPPAAPLARAASAADEEWGYAATALEPLWGFRQADACRPLHAWGVRYGDRATTPSRDRDGDGGSHWRHRVQQWLGHGVK